ncbi:TonB-dependent receptor [Pseudoduganella namucuonensis]|uniref:Iron complex outermembrane recepter protein n=1 Tax=Pseudoduganella namucuonensis TaxID=1035707 RepID=A0A1I7I7T4_9BURK|nr:TonB-dependent receptor [Pseudoduganella namucuonensis]SFU68914.1 iron complex outermembrane recepter protein [Pseudoduganella namucuonensis]
MKRIQAASIQEQRPTHRFNRLTPIASAAAVLVLSVAAPVQAQQAQAAPAGEPEVVVVSGIRGSLQQSLSVKRNAAANIEVITAEDVGKMPDKNVADSLQRLPGVNISSSAAGSGGFDENDRVSLRGTAPALTQTTINGHALSSGDWFVLDQVGGAVGRTASYSLLPSEIVGQVIVRKTPTADLIEGGVSGTVDVITRHPLDFKAPLAIEGSVQAVYSTLAKKTDPQFSALVNWKNEANTLGVLLQGFSEQRSLRRDGQELLQYTQISPTSPVALAKPDLANVWYPRLIGSALFEQERKRKGGMVDVQFKPSRNFSLEATFFSSKLEASNYNRNYLTDMFGSGAFGGNVVPDSYTVKNGTLTSVNFVNKGTAAAPLRYGIVDEIVREGAYAKTEFLDLAGKWRPTDNLTVSGQFGKTKGTGATPSQGVYEGDVNNSGVSYQLNGLGSPATVKFPSINTANFTGTVLDWVFGYSPATTADEETYGQLDAAYRLDGDSVFKEIKFGLRGTDHKRSNYAVAQGPNWANTEPGTANTNPAWNGTTYPGDFASDLGGDFPRNVWQLDRGILQAWGDLHSNRSTDRVYYPDMFNLTEKTKAAYVATDLEGDNWSGNIGVRVVRTEGRSNGYQILPNQLPGGNLPAFPWGGFVQQTRIDNNHTEVLPSANLRLDVAKDVVARLAISRTMTRPDFGALGGTVSLTDETHTGNGGNAALKPTLSTNLDGTLQWYFAPRALASVGVFFMDLKDYVGYGTSRATFIDSRASQLSGKGVFAEYVITSPINVGAKVKGLELALQLPVGAGFGVDGNLTLADSQQKFGSCPATTTVTSTNPCDMLGASKVTANIGGYFENDTFNARIGYAWRSSYLAAQDRGTPLYQDSVGQLSASFNYSIGKNVVLTLSGQNLNNPILKNYIYNKDQPGRFYSNGAQYYAGLRFKY